jgi:hypothetical protein
MTVEANSKPPIHQRKFLIGRWGTTMDSALAITLLLLPF